MRWGTSLVLAALCSVLTIAPLVAQPAGVAAVTGHDSIRVMQADEDSADVAHSYGLALEHLEFANGIKADDYLPEIAAGTPVLIPGRRILPLNPPSDGIVLNIPERGLFLFRHGQFVKFYPVAVGRPHFETPRGQFSIIEKVKNPTWAPPKWAGLGEIVMPAGGKNPLGDRWIGLSAHGVGIHGTVSPAAIGENVSHGCIRMYPDFSRQLFEQVSVGMPVRIEYEPVKVGLDRATGTFYMAVYPDVYGLVDPVRRAQTLVREARIPVSSARVANLARQMTGRAMPLSTDSVIIKADDIDVPSMVAPLRQGTSIWLPLDVVREAGVSVDTQTEQSVTLKWKDHTTEVSLQDGHPTDAASGYRWKGIVYVPAGSALHALGVPYRWLADTATLWIRPTVEPAEAGLQ